MRKPLVAIVGRPNVGKSTLFNLLAGERIAIVKDTPGVTRDRIYADASWLKYNFTLVDTGGIEPDSSDKMLKFMRNQAEMAIELADVVIFLTDVRSGLLDADVKVAQMLRKSKKEIVLVVNKVDNFEKYEADVYEFYNLGLGEPFPISAISKLGIGDMLDEVVSKFYERVNEEEEDERPRIAIIGKPNVGKSSLINKLIGEERVIVSDVAGTTRDAIDTVVKRDGKEYVFIDTAGLRRKSKVNEEIERYSIIRTVSAVERCDVAVLVIDAKEGVTEQDAKIAGIAHDRGRGMIIVVNKWDAIEKDNHSIKKYTEDIRKTLSFMPYAEIIFVSALTGQRLHRLFELIEVVIQNHSLRVSTGVLNDILTEAVALQQPPTDKGRRLKIYYITEVKVKPPTFVIFVNSKKIMHYSYTRYLENKIREAFGFVGTPLKFIVREKEED
ncbi:MAG: ribosome biogenesis GTPase Der [Lachnospiraceae bacterium]|nr:ribosome biogenesis GTPase Der [Lachnospiraceae bacterium]